MFQVKKTAYYLFTFFVYFISYAQVGINTNTPASTLDVSAPRTSTGAFDNSQFVGIQAPRLNLEDLSSLSVNYGPEQKGVIIYITDINGGNTNGQRANINTSGYYYFDGSAWQNITRGGDTSDDAWVNDPANSKIVVGSKSDGSPRDPNTDFVALDNGQIGIGTSTPDASAKLDIHATDKGVLLPNVALTSNTDQTTVANPAKGLLVYNTGTDGLDYIGFVLWDGAEWKTLFNTSTGTGTIDNMLCSNSSLSPATYTSGQAYSGTLGIPYIGGNGGIYDAQTIGPINGLTATLTPGNFNLGNGDLVYTVTGTPTVSSPTSTSFNINIGEQSCTAVVGIGERPRIDEFAQVSFESFGYETAGIAADNTLADIDPGSKNIARVKRLGRSVFRVDFIVPFKDTSYVVAGYGYEPGLYNRNNTQPYLYIPNYVTKSGAALSEAIEDDMDVDPDPALQTNKNYNLELRKTIVKPDGYESYVSKFKTHFYIVEGYANYWLSGASLLIIR